MKILSKRIPFRLVHRSPSLRVALRPSDTVTVNGIFYINSNSSLAFWDRVLRGGKKGIAVIRIASLSHRGLCGIFENYARKKCTTHFGVFISLLSQWVTNTGTKNSVLTAKYNSYILGFGCKREMFGFLGCKAKISAIWV